MRLIKILLLLALLHSKVFAIDLGLYSDKAIVADRSHGQWSAAVSDSLAKVMVKVSGNLGVTSLGSIQDVIAQPDELVQHFGYEESSDSLSLYIGFDVSQINKILSNTGQAIWSGDRPQTLIWFYNKVDDKYLLLAEDSSLLQHFQKTALSRGVKVFFPMIELGNTQISFSEVNAALYDDILKYSLAYKVDQVLVGINDYDGHVNWQLFSNGVSYSWSHEEGDISTEIANAVNHMVDGMVARNAIFQDKLMQAKITLLVDDISGLSDYEKILNFFKKNPAVVNVNVSKIDGTKVLFKVTVKGGSAALTKILASNSNFSIKFDPDAYNEADMTYSWVGH